MWTFFYYTVKNTTVHLLYNPTSNGKVTVKPRVPYCTAITLYTNHQVTMFGLQWSRFHLKKDVRLTTVHWLGKVVTFRQGLSVWAPTIEKPLPGWYLAPTANAMIVEKLLMTKYYGKMYAAVINHWIMRGRDLKQQSWLKVSHRHDPYTLSTISYYLPHDHYNLEHIQQGAGTRIARASHPQVFNWGALPL